MNNINLYKFKNFNNLKKLNEKLTIDDAIESLFKIFKKFRGEVPDDYLKKIWDDGSTLRELYDKDLFDKAWKKLVDENKILKVNNKWIWR